VQWGLLLESDRTLPSVASVVAGEPIPGSWWGHPSGHAIYACAEALESRDDVLRIKLLSNKVTYVHERLWSYLFAVATARDDWQLDGLEADALTLLGLVDEDNQLRLDELPPGPRARDAARQLESRLLVCTESIHTERGAHFLQLESWRHWASRVALGPPFPVPAEARIALEEIVERLNGEFGARALLPWQAKKGPASRRRQPVSPGLN
jgi:hypothetical protein